LSTSASSTTVAKAKALSAYLLSRLITKARKGVASGVEGSTHAHRVIFSYLRDKHAVRELFREVVPRVGDRPGGFTRILKIGNRQGDNAEMAIIELVDFNELAPGKASKSSGGRRRRRRGGSSKSTGAKQQQQTPEVQEEANDQQEAIEAAAEETEEVAAEATEQAEDKAVQGEAQDEAASTEDASEEEDEKKD
jgi:large subunit ribosomal protein L17